MSRKKATAKSGAKSTAQRGAKQAGVGDAAVKEATGKSWKQWFALLDRAGAEKLSHREIVARLRERHADKLSHWWMQQVTVAYEQARGMRAKHQKPGGFEVSASKTVGVPITVLYRAWRDARSRKRWLDDSGFTVRKATAEKSMRITWVDGETHVDAYFWAKGAAKSQVQIQHKLLADAGAAEARKAYWVEQLTRLKTTLEG